MLKGDVSPTIYGIETEYTATVSLPGRETHELIGGCHAIDDEPPTAPKIEVATIQQVDRAELDLVLGELGLKRNAENFLSNGAKLYLDPSGFEYATPETTTAEEAVHRTFDGDYIILKALERLREKEVIEGYQVNRRVTDHNRFSRGIHLNHSTYLGRVVKNEDLSRPFWSEVIRLLATLNVVKGAMFGSGGLLINETGKTEYHHSPRLSLTSQTYSFNGAYGTRPLVRLPFKKDQQGVYRIETITSDALNFAWPLRASLVVTNALIKQIELGKVQILPTLKQPVRAALNVGQFGNANQLSVQLPGGLGQTGAFASELIAHYCGVFLETDKVTGHLDDESRDVLRDVIETAMRLRAQPASVGRKIESIARLHVFKQKMKSSGNSLGSETMCQFDYYWDVLGRSGLAERIRQGNLEGCWDGFESDYSLATTRKRALTAPKNTRAKIRADIIANQDPDLVIDWGRFALADGQGAPTTTATYHPLQLTP